ncbi:hypothetical protein [Microcoleus sp. CAWBG58]|uniref:hypothetical protein n=1 Tax=Microcoleus sp. CAWBG58 TaxID=2841651 RepID=UPI0025E69A0D|nr:hypothetical protein [Microcoleus sp. CAWBG58]
MANDFFTRNNWFKASGFGVKIKIRRFIPPILGLKGRGNSQLSTVNCQLSTESKTPSIE